MKLFGKGEPSNSDLADDVHATAVAGHSSTAVESQATTPAAETWERSTKYQLFEVNGSIAKGTWRKARCRVCGIEYEWLGKRRSPEFYAQLAAHSHGSYVAATTYK